MRCARGASAPGPPWGRGGATVRCALASTGGGPWASSPRAQLRLLLCLRLAMVDPRKSQPLRRCLFGEEAVWELFSDGFQWLTRRPAGCRVVAPPLLYYDSVSSLMLVWPACSKFCRRCGGSFLERDRVLIFS
jgi:hypothetical protein